MTAAKSFKQMVKDGEIKRADAMKVRYEDLHVEPGFNLRFDIESLAGEDREQAEADEESLFQHIMAGGQIPDLEVRPRAEGGVWIVDGHRRHRNIGRAIAAGAPLQDKDGVVWINIKPFTGNDADRVARIITSQQNRKLTDLEKAEGCKRLAAFNWQPEQIAKAIGMTRQRVDQLLILANAPAAVQQMVKAGEVSGSVAVDVVRQHGDDAGKVLGGELEKAKAAGKGKVTAGTMKGPSIPRGLLDDLHQTVTRLHKAFTPDDLVAIERFHRGEITEGNITIPVELGMHLHLILEEGARVLAEKEQKLREKQNKDKQLELESEFAGEMQDARARGDA